MLASRSRRPIVVARRGRSRVDEDLHAVVLSVGVYGELVDPITLAEFSSGMGSMSNWNASSGQTVTFAESGPVWNVPAGVEVVSEITPNNTYARPPVATVPALNPVVAAGLLSTMLVGGSLWIRGLSRRRA